MSNRRLMAEQWDSFARATLPRFAPPIQRQEMRRAFYAGAQGIVTPFLGFLGPGPVKPEELEAAVDLQAELQEFAQLVKDGRA
jgi:hypothetical protein